MNDFPSLASLGWDPAWAEALDGLGCDLAPARVLRVDRGRCVVLTADGPVRATYGGRVLELMAADTREAPCTGDWSGVRLWSDGPTTVEVVLPRRSGVVRADVGGSSRGQVLAANLDVVAVVVGLVPEPSMQKVERLVALAWASGAAPVVVLTKSDLVGDAGQIAEDVTTVAPDAQVVTCSVVTGEGMSALRSLTHGNRTLGLLGSSGAGKSSLVNVLLGSEVLATRAIRDDGRGRHTSVRRELVPLPGGGAVLDTPGLRGVGLIDADDALAATFADVDKLTAHCKFNDCSHTAEPGCAVLEAVNTGNLPVRRLESWRKLRREMESMSTRASARLRAERRKAWSQRHAHRPRQGHRP